MGLSNHLKNENIFFKFLNRTMIQLIFTFMPIFFILVQTDAHPIPNKFSNVFSNINTLRILNGHEAHPLLSDSIVRVVETTSTDENIICTGFVVTPYHIMTAAHCFDIEDGARSWVNHLDSIYFSIKVGYDIENSSSYNVTKVYIPSIYDKEDHRNLEGDIAILTLENPLSNSTNTFRFAHPIKDSIYLNKTFFAAGYGKTDNGAYSDKLLITKVKIRSKYECASIHGWDSNFISHKCVTGLKYPSSNFTGINSGDSGGPLFLYHNEKLVVFGIASFYNEFYDVYATWYTDLQFYYKLVNHYFQNQIIFQI